MISSIYSEKVIAGIGCSAHMFGRIICGLAETDVVFYVGGGVSSLGVIATPIFKSMVSKLVQPHERGKAFAIFSMVNNGGSFLGGMVFAKVRDDETMRWSGREDLMYVFNI